jgi:hypothetical protein
MLYGSSVFSLFAHGGIRHLGKVRLPQELPLRQATKHFDDEGGCKPSGIVIDTSTWVVKKDAMNIRVDRPWQCIFGACHAKQEQMLAPVAADVNADAMPIQLDTEEDGDATPLLARALLCHPCVNQNLLHDESDYIRHVSSLRCNILFI